MTVHHRITWAHMTALEHGGHDKFLPSLSNPELRFTMASIREHFAAAVAALATLERVRALATEAQDPKYGPGGGCIYPKQLLAALAGQPEAPKGQAEQPTEWEQQKAFWDTATVDTYDLVHQGGYSGYNAMEKQKPGDVMTAGEWVRAEDYMRDLAAANARAEKAEAMSVTARLALKEDGEMQDKLDAANARIAELESLFQQTHGCHVSWVQRATEADAANARAVAACEEFKTQYALRKTAEERADAAEKGERDAVEALDANWVTHQRVVAAEARADAAERELKRWNTYYAPPGHTTLVDERDQFKTERDQLAARVKELQDELEQQHTLKPMQLCTPEERKVLEAIKRDHPTLYAHEANRAAKAKRGGE